METTKTSGQCLIGVIATGQVRSSAGIKNLKDFVERLGQSVLFVSTWNKRGHKSRGAINYTQLERMLGEPLAKLIPSDLYDEEFQKIMEGAYGCMGEEVRLDEFTTTSMYRVDLEPSELLALRPTKEQYDTNSKKMLYKMWKGVEMLEQYELEHQAQFTHILRCRLDQKFPEDFAPPQDRENKVYVDFVTSDGCGDCIILGERNIVAGCIKRLFVKALDDDYAWQGIHRELRKELLASNTKPVVAPNCPMLLGDQLDTRLLKEWVASALDEKREMIPAIEKEVACYEALLLALHHNNDSMGSEADYSINRILMLNDLSGAASLLSAVDNTRKEEWQVVAGSLYLYYIEIGFKGIKDRMSRRWLVWDAAKILAASHIDFDYLLEHTSSVLQALIEHHKEADMGAITKAMATIKGRSPWDICIKDYEMGREVCAIYDRHEEQELAHRYAMTILAHHEIRRDLAELIMHLKRRCGLHDQVISFYNQYGYLYGESRLIQDIYSEAEEHCKDSGADFA